jgi:hypothetical protein
MRAAFPFQTRAITTWMNKNCRNGRQGVFSLLYGRELANRSLEIRRREAYIFVSQVLREPAHPHPHHDRKSASYQAGRGEAGT